MASFTDQLINFNPYVSKVPVDDYVRVGLIKQKEYDEGVQKVQNYIDSVAGLEVMKSEQKDYLNQRIYNLQNEVSKVVSQDFSNQQLVNSVGSLTSKIESDPIIETSVASTQRYKAGVAKMKESQQKGLSSPSNEYVFQKSVQDWLNDGDVASAFTGDFTPFTDVNKKILGVIKELHPDSTLEDIPYKRGNNGQILMDHDGQPIIDYAMMQKQVKGLEPERIEAAIQASLDQNDLRQLQIDGTYTYRSYDKQALKGVTDTSYQYKLTQINDAIKGLLVDRQTNTSDAQHVAEVDRKIAALKSRAETYQSKYRQDIGALDSNPEGFKSNLYMQNWLSKFGDGFAYAENSLTYKENPYFMAAQREKEVDIKFQEFLVNKQFQMEDLKIKWAKLGLDREELELKKLAAGKKKPGEDNPLELTGAFLYEPIQQDALEKINVASVLDETQQLSNDIDNQKMALLAQVRPDLVHIVRSPDGKQRHYEYNVDGKNPDDIKNEAEATIKKLKDSYDKGEQVDDGTKTYFDNLANTSQRVQNRKIAINKINEEGDKAHNIDQFLSRVPSISVSSTPAKGGNYTTTGGGNFDATPEEQLSFFYKIKPYLSPNGSVAFHDPNFKDKIQLSPKEKQMYEVVRKYYLIGNLNDSEKKVISAISNIGKNVAPPAEGAYRARDIYKNNAIRDVVSATQPGVFPVEGFKQEDRGRVQSVVGNILNSIVAEDKESPNPRYDQKKLSAMLNNKNNSNTTYGLVAKGGNSYALRATNTDITDEPIEVDISRKQAEQLFGSGKFLDDFQAIRESLQLSKSGGKWTTDVSGQGRESAFVLRNGLVNKYGLKYHVEDPLKDGGLQVRLYIYDKDTKDWKERTANFGQLLNEAQVTRMLSALNDQQIDNLLGKVK